MKLALVTGANRGIGYEVCRQLGRHGVHVLLGSRDPGKGTGAAARLRAEGLCVDPITLDVTSPAGVNAAADELERRLGRLDILVNNAGGNFDYGVTPLKTSPEYFRETIELNLLGAWRVVQALAPLLKKSGSGRIVNVSSGAGAFSGEGMGLLASPGVTSYALSKLAINGLTVKLAQELKDDGIRVNAVCPGFTATQPGMAEMGARPVEDGARGIVWAALLPDSGPTGGFFREVRLSEVRRRKPGAFRRANGPAALSTSPARPRLPAFPPATPRNRARCPPSPRRSARDRWSATGYRG